MRATWASENYTNTYFGVNALQSAATGLGRFRTGSGLVSAGVNATLTKPLGRFGRDGAVTLFTSYDRLGDVVADSTLELSWQEVFSIGAGRNGDVSYSDLPGGQLKVDAGNDGLFAVALNDVMKCQLTHGYRL